MKNTQQRTIVVVEVSHGCHGEPMSFRGWLFLSEGERKSDKELWDETVNRAESWIQAKGVEIGCPGCPSDTCYIRSERWSAMYRALHPELLDRVECIEPVPEVELPQRQHGGISYVFTMRHNGCMSLATTSELVVLGAGSDEDALNKAEPWLSEIQRDYDCHKFGCEWHMGISPKTDVAYYLLPEHDKRFKGLDPMFRELEQKMGEYALLLEAAEATTPK